MLRTIKDRIKCRDLDGLLAEVDRAVELHGDRDDLRQDSGAVAGTRAAKLARQRDESYSQANELLAEGKAKAALRVIGKVRSKQLTDQQIGLKEDLEEMVAAEDELTALVKEANADGVIDAEEVIELLPKTEECLTLNPNHSEIRQLQQNLNTRLRSCPPFTNSIGMKLKLLPAGEFMMGELEARHQVTLTKPFEMGVHEVTQEQYEKVMGKNPSKFKGVNNPVERVSRNDAVEFCRKLSELPAEKEAGHTYRLPTEAEWEYACRAGTTTKFSFGDDESELGDYAWYEDNSGKKTHLVGEKKPNAWGLYDMHGNVAEWCQDYYGFYPSDPVTDPTGPKTGSFWVFRGGSWLNTTGFCKSSDRGISVPANREDDLGFRVARGPSSK